MAKDRVVLTQNYNIGSWKGGKELFYGECTSKPNSKALVNCNGLCFCIVCLCLWLYIIMMECG